MSVWENIRTRVHFLLPSCWVVLVFFRQWNYKCMSCVTVLHCQLQLYSFGWLDVHLHLAPFHCPWINKGVVWVYQKIHTALQRVAVPGDEGPSYMSLGYRTDFFMCLFYFFLYALYFSIVSLSYFIFAVPVRKCSREHSCRSYSFPIPILKSSSIFAKRVCQLVANSYYSGTHLTCLHVACLHEPWMF